MRSANHLIRTPAGEPPALHLTVRGSAVAQADGQRFRAVSSRTPDGQAGRSVTVTRRAVLEGRATSMCEVATGSLSHPTMGTRTLNPAGSSALTVRRTAVPVRVRVTSMALPARS